MPINEQELALSIDHAMRQTPSVPHSMYLSGKAGFLAPVAAISDIDAAYSHHVPEDTSLQDTLESIDQINSNVTGFQAGVDWASNLVGMALNPITMGLGEAGGVVAGKALQLAPRIIPDVASSLARRKATEYVSDENLAKLAETFPHMVKGGVIAPASMIPAEIHENYDRDTNNIRWGGVAKGLATDTVLGFGIPALPYAIGTIYGKITGGKVKTPELAPTPPPSALKHLTTADNKIPEMSPELLEKNPLLADAKMALDQGRITPKEHQLYTNYLFHGAENTENLAKDAVDAMLQDGHPIDVGSQSVLFKLMSQADKENAHIALQDQFLSNPPENIRNSLTDFYTKKSMGEMRKSLPKMMDGIQGYLDDMHRKISEKSKMLSQYSNLVGEHFLKKLQGHSLEEKKIFRVLKDIKGDTSKLSYTVPDNVIKRFNYEKMIKSKTKKIRQLELELKNSTRSRSKKLNAGIYNLKRDIGNLNEKMPVIRSAREELLNLRDHFDKENLPKNYQLSKEYMRLSELADFLPHAKTILDHIHLKEEYEKQEAYKDVVKTVTNIAKSSFNSTLDGKVLSEYLRNKIESTKPSETKYEAPKSLEEAKYEEKKQSEEAQKNETKGNVKENFLEVANESQVRSSSAEDLKSEFNDTNRRFQEFKEKRNVFSNMIHCLIGE